MKVSKIEQKCRMILKSSEIFKEYLFVPYDKTFDAPFAVFTFNPGCMVLLDEHDLLSISIVKKTLSAKFFYIDPLKSKVYYVFSN